MVFLQRQALGIKNCELTVNHDLTCARGSLCKGEKKQDNAVPWFTDLSSRPLYKRLQCDQLLAIPQNIHAASPFAGLSGVMEK